MSFVMPDGVEPDGYFEQIAVTMVGHGWSAGPPPGRHPLGGVIHTEMVMAIFGRAAEASHGAWPRCAGNAAT